MDVKRMDVLDDVLKFCNKDAELSGPKLPTQESLDGDSCASSLSWPLQDSGNAR